MNIEKLFKKIESLEDYISATQDVSKKYKMSMIQLNMSTVLSLKKTRFLEVEYFNKCNGPGAAFVIFERILDFPSSKIWGLLSKELVALLQHWLDATRKHLIVLNSNWWSFMKMLLKFIKELRLKDSMLPDLLVESTAEQLLDVATRTEPDVLQRQYILYCLNLCCADSSREVRFATRLRLESYFVKLSSLLAASGHALTQFSILETLLRWLLPRQNTSVRKAAAAKWFPDTLYKKEVVDIFLERLWQNFPQDAREFLNAHNQSKGLITSVIYRQISIGTVTIDCSDRRDSWLDINPASKSITVLLLDGRTMQDLGLTGATLQSLVINEDAVEAAHLTREDADLTLSIKTSRPVQVYPSDQTVGDGEDVVIVVSTRNDLRRMDNALKGIFGDKYKALIELTELTVTSPRDRNIKIGNSSEEDTRFSHPVRPSRRKASGYVLKSAASTWKSPSTTSTTSLALLHDRLEALPKFKFNKEPVKVSALPDLSIVSELTEINDTQSIASGTGINRRHGVSFKSFRKSEKQSQSDGEKYRTSKKYISPIVGVKEHDTSCLLVATIGSDESVINETIECLSKNKDCERDNIVELLLQEALQSKDEKLDSGIQTGENKRPNLRDSDAIENTPDAEHSKFFKRKKQNVNSDEKSEECNEIDGTQFEYVSIRKKVIIDKHKEIEEDIQQGIDANDMHTFDQEAVEKFFSQHIAEDRTGGLVVSPTLARKINETSSEGSDRANAKDIQNVEIIDCMNNIIDKVCHDFEKCAEILEKDNSAMDILKMAENKEADLQENVPSRVLANIKNLNLVYKKDVETPKKPPKQKKAIKLKFNTKRTANKTRAQKQKLETARKMSPIPESKDSVDPEKIEENDDRANNEHVIEDVQKPPEETKEIDNKPAEVVEAPVTDNVMASPEKVSPKSTDLNKPLIRKRRKLYSPKEDHDKDNIPNENTKQKETEVHVLQEDDTTDFKSNSKKTSKSAATCYKDIEKERKKIRLPRPRKSKGKAQTRSPSPRTKKMNDLFDNLKANVEKSEDIILADKKSLERDLAIFNFTSDSEDEDFKKKKFEIYKRFSTTTNASGDSITSRHGRITYKVNYSEKSSDENTKKARSKNVVRRKKVGQKRPHNLADEKMRDAQYENLNASFVLEKDREALKDPELNLEAPLLMETIGSEIDEPAKVAPRPKRTGKKKKKIDAVAVKHEKGIIDDKNDNDDRTLSPLPGLVIERVPVRKDDPNDSVSTQVMNKLKKIYHGGPNALDELNTTQNLLLDVEKIDFSQHLNITNELEKSACNVFDVTERNLKDVKPKPRTNNAILNDEENIIQVISYGKTRSEKDGYIGNISISDVQSEKSIATVGKSPINAHGDIEEDPPDNLQLHRRVQSRNLEIEDMDTSIKDYYLRLREEINKPVNSSTSNSSKQDVDLAEKKTENRSQKCISPVVSVCKMSLDYINKTLAPNSHSSKDKVDVVERLSEKESKKSSSPDVPLSKTSYDIEKTIPSKAKSYKPQIDLVDERSENISRKSISPVVSLNKISYDDISKWLPSRRNSCDSSAHSSEKSVVIEKVKVKNEVVAEKTKFVTPRPKDSSSNMTSVSRKRTEEIISSCKTSDKDTVKEIPKSQKSITLHYDLRSAKSSSIKKIKNYSTPVRNNNDQNSIRTRKTLISPIKLFDEPDDLLENKGHKSNDVISRVTENESVKHIQNEIKSPIFNISASTNEKVYDLRKSVNISSCESRISSSTRVDGKAAMRSTLKRKSVSPVKDGKKSKVEVLTDSGPSMSSIDDWFKKSAPISAAESLSASYGDSLQNIMEKLDTTLAEIHQNTSKNFLHMFVDAQRQLSSLKDERRRALKQVATEVLKEVVNVLDTKFEDLEKRTQEMDTEFKKQLKRRAAEFVREDCKKKRVMVALLQDDIKAVLKHVNTDRDSQ